MGDSRGEILKEGKEYVYENFWYLIFLNWSKILKWNFNLLNRILKVKIYDLCPLSFSLLFHSLHIDLKLIGKL